jgi:hypothetical protein
MMMRTTKTFCLFPQLALNRLHVREATERTSALIELSYSCECYDIAGITLLLQHSALLLTELLLLTVAVVEQKKVKDVKNQNPDLSDFLHVREGSSL